MKKLNVEAAVDGDTTKGHIVGPHLARFRQSRPYDWLMRLPLLVWSMLLATATMADLERYVHTADRTSKAIFAINIAMRIATFTFLVFLAASTTARMRPSGKARGIEPRVSALLGTVLFTPVILLPHKEISVVTGLVSTLMILSGNALAIFVLAQLGRSFSVMAEARRLITSGIYRFVRHPLYLAEEVTILGIYLQFRSPWTTLLLLLQLGFQLRRMQNEEALLSDIFPDYLAYRQHTARLVPGIY